MRAGLDDSPRVDHDDAIGLLHGAEPMGDDERRATSREPLERGANVVGGLGIERARRLVEDEDGRVLEDRARDRDALPLAARQEAPALPTLVS